MNVALDDQVLAGAAADKLRPVMGEAELSGERVPVVLPGQPVGASLQFRLKDVRGVRTACGSPIVTAPAIELPNSRSIAYRSVGLLMPRRWVSRSR